MLLCSQMIYISVLCASFAMNFLSTRSLYSFMVKTREEAAIKELVSAGEDTKPSGSAEGSHLHVVHLSDARASLRLIKVEYLLPSTIYFIAYN